MCEQRRAIDAVRCACVARVPDVLAPRPLPRLHNERLVALFHVPVRQIKQVAPSGNARLLDRDSYHDRSVGFRLESQATRVTHVLVIASTSARSPL